MTGKLPWNIHAGCTAYREVPFFRKRGAFQTPRVHPSELVAQHKKRANKNKVIAIHIIMSYHVHKLHEIMI